MAEYDAIICGTGFASSFFLMGVLRRKRNKLRILILERGENRPYDAMLAARSPSSLVDQDLYKNEGMPKSEKIWKFTMGMGGSSNCWWGQTPRQLPNDFNLFSAYGVGKDWPVKYADLEKYYDDVEQVMSIAGPDIVPFPKSGKYPQPAHPISSLDRRMIDIVGPESWIASPTSRSSLGTSNRGKCCANGVCGLCPVDAKFRVMNELSYLYADGLHKPDLRTGAEVKNVIVESGQARGVTWIQGGKEFSAKADVVFLGLNALFNPSVLKASGDVNPLTGKGLTEGVSQHVVVDFGDIDNFDGGTHITGLGYMFYDGEHRRNHGACLVENYNAPPILRTENGKWLKRALFKIVAENLPELRNEVVPGNPPVAKYLGHSSYGLSALELVKPRFNALMHKVGAVESIEYTKLSLTEGHIQGTTIMGLKGESVLDRDLQHHNISGLYVGGSGAFPSCPPANPSLTIAALSLRAADRVQL